MPNNVFTKLYDSTCTVWSVISLWRLGMGQYIIVLNQCGPEYNLKFVMGVAKYTPNNALYGECGRQPPYVKQWRSMSQQ